MIQALILDIDGVIVGDKEGFNFPHPHPDVVAALRSVHQNGLPVSLCTAKPDFSIEKVIEDAGLDNPHITNGGAVIIDPIDHKIIAQHSIAKSLAREVVSFAVERELYLELYTVGDCFVWEEQRSDFTDRHAEVEHRMPTLLPKLEPFLDQNDLVKIFFIAPDENWKAKIDNEFREHFADKVLFTWTMHPKLLPYQFGVVTAAEVSKAHGAQEIAKSSGVDLSNTLGIGDTLNDWQFMELCGYAAAMGNATDELKEKVRGLGDHGYIGPSVNDNGLIDILQHFSLFS